MPSLSAHKSSGITKLLLIGDSGTGKTGSLTSLAVAGYKLRILDYDNGLDPLRQFITVKNDKALDNVEYRTLRDRIKASPSGPIIDGKAESFVNGLKMLDQWKYDVKDSEGKIIETVDLGKPSNWGEDTIVVVDSLTFMSDAAFNWAKSLNPGAKEPRQWFYAAQQAVESMIALLTSEGFNCNVIVIAHVRYQTNPDGTMKGYPTSVGSALGPTIPAYFNSVALAESSGSGEKLKKTIRTTPTAMIDLKNPAPFKMVAQLPIDTALADFFKTVRS